MPGRADAGAVPASNAGVSKIRAMTSSKQLATLSSLLADASTKRQPCVRAHASPSRVLTARSSARSTLLPVSILTTLPPPGEYICTSPSHASRCSNVSGRVTSYTWEPEASVRVGVRGPPETALVCSYQDDAMGSTVITRSKGSETLLPCSVPNRDLACMAWTQTRVIPQGDWRISHAPCKLQRRSKLTSLPANIHSLDLEVNTDCRVIDHGERSKGRR